jgi:hypothetical protein
MTVGTPGLWALFKQDFCNMDIIDLIDYCFEFTEVALLQELDRQPNQKKRKLVMDIFRARQRLRKATQARVKIEETA